MQQRHGGSVAYVFMLASVAALGGLLFGYDTAVIAGAIGFLKREFIIGQYPEHLVDLLEGWAVSNVLVGCMIGAALAGTLSDRFGRKRVLLLSAVLFAVSAIGSAIPQNLSQFVVARMLGGFAVGMASMLSPMYIAEVSPARIRGRLVSLNQVTIISGMLVVSIVNWMIASPENESWNVFNRLALDVRVGDLAGGVLPGVPVLRAGKSPLAHQAGTPPRALAILTRVGGAERAKQEMLEIEDAVAHEGGSIRELFRPGIRVALAIAVVLAILQQVTGINAVMYYAPKIFESAEVTATQALLQTVVVQVVNVLFTLVAIWVVDRRRSSLLLVTSAAMGVSLVLLGGAFFLELSSRWIFLFTLAYVASFAVAMGPVVWVLLAEIFPTRTRGRAMGVATVALWVACFAVSQSVPWMFEHLGQPATFWSYALMCLVSLVFVAAFVPETKGKTLEQIERSWTR